MNIETTENLNYVLDKINGLTKESKIIVLSEYFENLEWISLMIHNVYKNFGLLMTSNIKQNRLDGNSNHLRFINTNGSICDVYFKSEKQGVKSFQGSNNDLVICLLKDKEKLSESVYYQLLLSLMVNQGTFYNLGVENDKV